MKQAFLIPKNYLLYFSIFLFAISSCNQSINKEEIKNEIIQSEKAFQDVLNAQGPAAAFYEFAADSAVIKRENDTLIIGKNAIKNYYSVADSKNVRATWKPDFINVSDDGSLAYTYGKYEWAIKDSTGKESVFHGVFHTVWKRMADKKWKYVWD